MVIEKEISLTLYDGFVFGLGFLVAQVVGGLLLSASFALIGSIFLYKKENL